MYQASGEFKAEFMIVSFSGDWVMIEPQIFYLVVPTYLGSAHRLRSLECSKRSSPQDMLHKI